MPITHEDRLREFDANDFVDVCGGDLKPGTDTRRDPTPYAVSVSKDINHSGSVRLELEVSPAITINVEITATSAMELSEVLADAAAILKDRGIP